MKRFLFVAVPVLLLILLFCSSWSAPEVQAADDADAPEAPALESVLSYDTLALVTVRNYDDLLAKIKRLPAYSIFLNPSVQKFFEKPWAKIQKKMTESGTELDLSLQELLAVPSGQIALVLHRFELNKANVEDPPFVSASIFVHVGGHKKELDKVVQSILKKTEADAKTKKTLFKKDVVEHQGKTIQKLTLGKPTNPLDNYYYYGVDYFVWGANNLDEIKTIIDSYGRQSLPNCLANNPDFMAAQNAIGPNPDGYMYLNFKPFVGMIEEGIKSLSGMAMMFGGGGQELDAAAVVDAMGFNGLDNFAYGFSLKKDQAEITSYMGAKAPRKGFVSFASMPRVDATPATYVPNDVNSYLHIGFDFDNMWQQIVAIVESFGPQASGGLQMMLGMMEGQIGINMEKDIIKPLGKSITIYTQIEQPFSKDSQNIVFMIDLSDATTAATTVDTLQATATAQTGGMISIVSEKYKTYTIYSQSSSKPEFDADGNFEMVESEDAAYAVIGNELIFSNKIKCIKAIADSLKKPDATKSLAQLPAFKNLERQYGITNPSMIYYSDSHVGIDYLEWQVTEFEKQPKDGDKKNELKGTGFDMINFLDGLDLDWSLRPDMRLLKKTGRYSYATATVTDKSVTSEMVFPYPKEIVSEEK